MTSIRTKAPKVEIEFSNEALTASGGVYFVSEAARRLGLPRMLGERLRLKQRQRGSSDVETIMSLVLSLAQGNGALSDLDRLRADEAQLALCCLSLPPGSRRAGEYLQRFDEAAVETLRGVARDLARPIARKLIDHEMQIRGYVPLFVDGSEIEVDGRYFEGAKVGYSERVQLWLHNIFLSKLWLSQELLPGGGDVRGNYLTQLRDDVVPLLRESDAKVWLRVDNAYYCKDLIEFCIAQRWDYSVSVTHGVYKAPLLRQAAELSERDWKPLNSDGSEEAAFLFHRPDGWPERETYVVIRSHFDGTQRLLVPRVSFILVSRNDLPIAELIRRHRAKQGQENAQKGPLIDLDLHHPPCHKLLANRAFYTAGQLAQLLLCAVQFGLLPPEARKHSIRTVIRDVVRSAAKVSRHSRRLSLLFGRCTFRRDWIDYAASMLSNGALIPAS